MPWFEEVSQAGTRRLPHFVFSVHQQRWEISQKIATNRVNTVPKILIDDFTSVAVFSITGVNHETVT